jgi:predicted RNA binding protein YcfA (HicA-like mRNA interferase family)
VKFREFVAEIRKDGWWLDHTTGSHQQFRHDKKPGTVTVAGHPNEDIPKGTLNSMMKQAGLKK